MFYIYLEFYSLHPDLGQVGCRSEVVQAGGELLQVLGDGLQRLLVLLLLLQGRAQVLGPLTQLEEER